MADAPKKTFPCPKCNRTLVQSGVITMPDGTEIPTFQCDECLVEVEIFGQRETAALTFALGPDDKPYDPAAPDGRLRF